MSIGRSVAYEGLENETPLSAAHRRIMKVLAVKGIDSQSRIELANAASALVKEMEDRSEAAALFSLLKRTFPVMATGIALFSALVTVAQLLAS